MYFYWLTMRNDVQEWFMQCVIYPKVKYDRGKAFALLQPLTIPDKPWESIAMDFKLGLPKCIHYNNGIWTILVCYNNQAHFVPIKRTIKMHHMAKLFISNIFVYHVMPTSIVSHKDPRMTSLFWQGKLRYQIKVFFLLSSPNGWAEWSC